MTKLFPRSRYISIGRMKMMVAGWRSSSIWAWSSEDHDMTISPYDTGNLQVPNARSKNRRTFIYLSARFGNSLSRPRPARLEGAPTQGARTTEVRATSRCGSFLTMSPGLCHCMLIPPTASLKDELNSYNTLSCSTSSSQKVYILFLKY